MAELGQPDKRRTRDPRDRHHPSEGGGKRHPAWRPRTKGVSYDHESGQVVPAGGGAVTTPPPVAEAVTDAPSDPEDELPVPMGLPPDLRVQGKARGRKEYWHLPRDVWDKIHSRATGKGIVIANLDTGYNPEHPLMPEPRAVKNFTGAGPPIDGHGHGSHTIGTNCARDGRISPAPEADLIVGKVLADNGTGSSASIAAGIRWAVDAGANIISMSLGGNRPYGPTREAIRYANEKGVVVVAAAGNDGYQGIDTIGYPGRYPETICVGAYRRDGKIASFSSGGREIDLAAPGQDIVSLSHQGSGLARMSGTSMATPYVAALFALVLELILREGAVWPLPPAWWREFIAKHAEDRGAPGKDERFGVGVPRYTAIVDALANDDLRFV